MRSLRHALAAIAASLILAACGDKYPVTTTPNPVPTQIPCPDGTTAPEGGHCQ